MPAIAVGIGYAREGRQSTQILWDSVDYLARADVTRQPAITHSAGHVVIFQKLPLGLPRAAAKRAIAMGEPPEFFDHIPMLPRVAQLLRIIEHLVQSYTAILIEQRLGMHERQIEKRPHRQIGRLIKAARKCAISHSPSHRIGREGARFPAKHIARKLVEEKHERERALCAVLPSPKPAACSGLVRCKESRSNSEVKRVVARESLVGPSFAPESHNLRGADAKQRP